MIKGYPSQEKDDRLNSQLITVEPVRQLQNGLSVNAHMYVYEVATDAAEALSTTYSIIATGHVAQVGDVIRFTSGTHSGREVKVWEIETNLITLAETLASAVATGVTFQILRHKYPVVDSAGGISMALPTGAATEAKQDVGNASLATLAGAVLAGEVKVAIQSDLPLSSMVDSITSYQGGLYNITNISGTITLPVGASSAANQVTEIGHLATLAGAVAGTEVQVDVLTSALPTGAATEAKQDTGNTSLGTIAGAVSGSEMQVDIVAALPAGTNNIGDVDVLSLPSIPAGTNNIGDVDVLSLPADIDIRDLSSAQDSVAAVQSGTWNINNISGTVSLPTLAATSTLQTTGNTSLATIAGAVSGTEMQVDVLTLPSIPAGTNNIGDVDVLSLPSIPAGTNTIGNVIVIPIKVVDLFDANILDTSSTNIPGSAGSPVTVVASTAAQIDALQIIDTTGAFIGLYTGAAASEVLRLVIGPGSDQTIFHGIPAGTRVSLRRLDSTTAISSGIVAVNFLG